MKSPERMAISSSLVSQLIASQFPQWAHLPIEPVEFDGWDITTFHLGTTPIRATARRRAVCRTGGEGTSVVAKTSSTPSPSSPYVGSNGDAYLWLSLALVDLPMD